MIHLLCLSIHLGGTKAAEYTDHVSEEEKQNRLERLIDIQKKNTLVSNRNQIGKILPVMVEKVSKKSPHQWAGRTEGNMWVIFDMQDEAIKDIVNIKIDDAQGVTLFGSRLDTKEKFMKLLKYLFFVIILICSLVFLVELNNINTVDGQPITIKVPYLFENTDYKNGFNVWIVLVGTLTAGVLIGFFLALFQIISQTSEAISLRSKLRRLQVELDSLRNQAIDDDIIISNDVEVNENE